MGAGPCTRDARRAGASQALGVGGTCEDHKCSLGRVIRADGDQGKRLTRVLLLFFPSTLQLSTFGVCLGFFFFSSK